MRGICEKKVSTSLRGHEAGRHSHTPAGIPYCSTPGRPARSQISGKAGRLTPQTVLSLAGALQAGDVEQFPAG